MPPKGDELLGNGVVLFQELFAHREASSFFFGGAQRLNAFHHAVDEPQQATIWARHH